MTPFKRASITALLAAFLCTGLLLPFSAKASEDGRRNTTLGLGALTGVLLYKKQWLPAAAAGVGTYYAYHNWQAQINARHRYENTLHYRHAYRLGYTRGRSYGRRLAHYRSTHRSHHRS